MNRIAIIDDDDESRELLSFIVEDAGYIPELIVGVFGNDKSRLISEITSRDIYGVISDHRLGPGNLASFSGSELLADLYDLNIPSVLITQFLDVDADTSIRKYRDRLPAVIGRGSQDPDLIRKLLNLSKEELVNGPNYSRRPHRALIRIDDLQSSLRENLIEGVVTNWSSETLVKFPVELLSADVKEKIKNKDMCRLMAFINTGASDQKDLYITDIHIAPDLEGTDGIG